MAAFVRVLVINFLFGSFTLVQNINVSNATEMQGIGAPIGVNVHDQNLKAAYDIQNSQTPQGAQPQFRLLVVPRGGPGFVSDVQGNKMPPKPETTGGKPAIRIWDSVECGQEVQRLCSRRIQKNNFAILDCWENADEESVTEDCQYFLYHYKRNLTLDVRFDSTAKQVCSQELEMFQDCKNLPDGPGMKIPCLVEHMDEQGISPNCRQYLARMAAIVFSDYRLIYKFADVCNDDIQKSGCGRFEENWRDSYFQGAVLDCLAKKLATLNPKCKRKLLRVAELQSDDYHMDRPLYYACREDRERFCEKIPAGGGKVFECLFKHKFDQEMSKNIVSKAKRGKVVVQRLVPNPKNSSDVTSTHAIKCALITRDIAKARIYLEDIPMQIGEVFHF